MPLTSEGALIRRGTHSSAPFSIAGSAMVQCNRTIPFAVERHILALVDSGKPSPSINQGDATQGVAKTETIKAVPGHRRSLSMSGFVARMQLALIFVLLVCSQSSAHDSWISRGGLRNA